ncbi:MAG: PEP-CTERM sorting domain-containing protein [Bryobacteraceae bacterium]
MTRFKLPILALTLLALGAAAALADDLQLGGNYVSVTVDESGVGATQVGGGPITISYLNGAPLAYVYCVGFFTTINVPGDYTDTGVRNDSDVNGLAVNNAGAIALLLDQFAMSAAGNLDDERALQAAIWSLEYNGSGTDFDGSVGANSYHATITADIGQNYYNKYLSDMAWLGTETVAEADAAISTIDWFSPSVHGELNQGLVGPHTAGAVPEPVSILLFATLLVLAGTLKRKALGARGQ